MVWIYEDPLTKKEKATYAILLKRLPDKKAAIQRTKILSLTGYILSNKFISVFDTALFPRMIGVTEVYFQPQQNS